MSRDRNADYNAVARTNEFVDVHAPPAVRPLGGGPLVDRVACPLCRTPTDLYASLRGPEGRCTRCTVIVRVVAGKPHPCGWMGGGDITAAGRALRRRRRSIYETEPPPQRPAGEACGDRVGSTSGYYRHKSACENPCDQCRDAYRAYNRQSKAERKAARQDAMRPCGTDAAYRRHLRAGETPCDECRAAHARRVTLDATKRRKAAKAREQAAA